MHDKINLSEVIFTQLWPKCFVLPPNGRDRYFSRLKSKGEALTLISFEMVFVGFDSGSVVGCIVGCCTDFG